MQLQKGYKTAIVAVIYNGGKVLCVRKLQSDNVDVSNKWVFPGCLYDKCISLDEALKKIVKSDVFIGEHVLTCNYSKHEKYDIAIHVYSCKVDSEIELRQHYSECQWVDEDKLEDLSQWHECYHDVLAKLKPISNHFCSRVRYDLYGMYDYIINYECHDPLYGTEQL